jgi:hypothetical protein
MKQTQQMAELFKVEELEERLEFADWEASAGGSTDGTNYEVQAEVSVSW